MLRLIVFDFDGTLVDTAPDIILAVNEFLQIHHQGPLSDEQVVSKIGMGLKDLIKDACPQSLLDPKRRLELELQFMEIYHRHHLNQAKVYEGVFEFLAQWPNQLAIVSNKKEAHVRSLLSHLGLSQAFPWLSVIGGDSLKEKKPHPLPLQTVMEKAKLGPEQCLMVGDGTPDMGAAQAVGMKSVAVSFGYSPVQELKSLGAWKCLNHYCELPEIVRQFNEEWATSA